MNNQEAADELQYAINLIKQDGKDWLDERDIPILEAAISALQEKDSPKPTAGSVQNVQNEDLISRKAAIDAVENIDCSDGVGISALKCEAVGDVVTAIKALPSAQPEPQWIPVSERLPGENEFVLVTFGWFGRKTDPGVNIDEIRDGDWMISEVVTAWMPLPEPYRAERRNDERSD